MKMERPKGYVDQDGCRNCEHALVEVEYDDPEQYYCMFGAVHPRPPLGTVELGKSKNLGQLWLKMSNSDNYYGPKGAEAWGKCPNWTWWI